MKKKTRRSRIMKYLRPEERELLTALCQQPVDMDAVWTSVARNQDARLSGRDWSVGQLRFVPESQRRDW